MRKKLLVDGMRCKNCVNHLRNALEENIEGVKVLDISLEEKYAEIEMTKNITEDMLKSIINDLGYELRAIE